MKVSDIIENIEELKGKTKIHFATGSVERRAPLFEYYRGEFKQWQEDQNKKNFERKYIFSLIEIDKDEWLFVGIYSSNSYEIVNNRVIYNTKLLDISSDLIGRLVIKYNKSFRSSYVYLERYLDDFELLEIRREKYTVEPFPGYENVKVKYGLIKSIISQNENSWKTALSNVKGVYLISDLQTGKLYVGSAYGKYAFWTRWTEYTKNGHGNNKQLKKMLSEKGNEYADNFQFSVLETRSMNAEDNEITNRESYWKEILLTRQFGYNEN